MSEKCKCGKRYPHLFSPLRIGNIKMKNRIICAPTSPSMIDLNGHFTPEMIAYLEEKAMGGAGVVTYGEAIVHSATGKSHNKQLQLWRAGKCRRGCRHLSGCIWPKYNDNACRRSTGNAK